MLLVTIYLIFEGLHKIFRGGFYDNDNVKLLVMRVCRAKDNAEIGARTTSFLWLALSASYALVYLAYDTLSEHAGLN